MKYEKIFLNSIFLVITFACRYLIITLNFVFKVLLYLFDFPYAFLVCKYFYYEKVLFKYNYKRRV